MLKKTNTDTNRRKDNQKASARRAARGTRVQPDRQLETQTRGKKSGWQVPRDGDKNLRKASVSPASHVIGATISVISYDPLFPKDKIIV